MAFTSAQKSVTTADPLALTSKGRKATIRNTDATNSVFLGGPAVTTATGYELKAGQVLQLDGFMDDLYAIATGATVRVDVLQGRGI